jgi:hypothetical protein
MKRILGPGRNEVTRCLKKLYIKGLDNFLFLKRYYENVQISRVTCSGK